MDDKKELLIRVAELYYEENLNQNDIAKILNTSRPTVSRLLDEAKDTGVVEIIVHSPILKDAQLAYALRKKLGLRDAVVVSGEYKYEKAIRRCCETALQYFYAIMENNTTIGISWGTVPHQFCEMLEDREYYNVNVVQMVGCLGTGNPKLDGLELALRISRKLGGTYSNIYAPVYVENKIVHDYLMAEPQIAATIKKAMHTDIIITGVGSFDAGTSLQLSGNLNDKDRMELIEQGAVGHLLARPYDKDGNEIIQRGRYTIGAPLEAMKHAQWSVGVSAAEFKAEAVLAAVRGGYLNTLVVDEILAKKLLELAD
ncbi:MAG: hypothetical protein GX488_00125 [Clostridiales bacterium]|nr:hypothetical protein [Clostridiales bacterium]